MINTTNKRCSNSHIVYAGSTRGMGVMMLHGRKSHASSYRGGYSSLLTHCHQAWQIFFFFISLQYRFLWILSLFLSAGRKFIVKNNNKTKHEWSQSLGYQLSGSGVIYTYECVLPQWLEMLDHGEDGSVPVRTPPLASIYNDDTCRWHRVISATSASLSFSSKTYFIIHWLTKT